jgi:glucokinase
MHSSNILKKQLAELGGISAMTMLMGIDVGGTNLRLGVLDNGLVIDDMRFQANFSEICKNNPSDIAWHKIVEVTAKAINEMLRKHPDVSAIGIGFPGFIDPKTQKILQSPNLPGLLNVDLSAALSAIVKLAVLVENDALVAAYGEFRSLDVADKATVTEDIQDLIYVGLGTGVGGGLILNGQPFGGQHGMAMEIGHMITVPNGRLCGCGNCGCMEQYASATGVALSYQELTGQNITVDAIAALARAGDVNAIEAYTVAGLNLATALANIIKVLDIRVILIGGGMSQAWDLIADVFHVTLNAALIPVLRGKVEVKISNTGDQAGIIGAALLVNASL